MRSCLSCFSEYNADYYDLNVVYTSFGRNKTSHPPLTEHGQGQGRKWGRTCVSGCGCVQENDRARSSEISFCHKMSMQGPVTFKLIQLVRCWLFVFYLLVSKSCTSAISCDSLHDTRGLPNCCFEPSVTRARICHGVGSAPVTARSTASTSCYISAISPAHV